MRKKEKEIITCMYKYIISNFKFEIFQHIYRTKTLIYAHICKETLN